MPIHRDPPDLGALFALLARHGVRYVVIGSTAACLHGVDLRPGDLDIVAALDPPNLERLARALDAAEARPDPNEPFGDWQMQPDGERRWIERLPLPGEREARLSWRADPADPRSFDHQFATAHGAFDVVSEVIGTYDDLRSRAATVEAFGQPVLMQGIADLLASITVPRREKDRERVRTLRALQRAQLTVGATSSSSPSVPEWT